MLVDIGAGTTDISIYTEGSVSYSSVLAIGARHITNDLAIGLRISLESAEKIKLFFSQQREHRLIKPEGEEEERKEERSRGSAEDVDLSDLLLPEDLRKVSEKTLVDGIIRPRLNEIATMIGLEIKKSGFGGQTPAGVVITGGGALTVGVKDSMKRMLAMPVRIGLPANMKGLIDEIENPSYATVIGLAMYGARNVEGKSMPFGLSMPKIPGMLSSGFLKKIVNVIKSFIP